MHPKRGAQALDQLGILPRCKHWLIRRMKTQQKISGRFRTLHGARVFARIRSYICTCRKQGRNILEALEGAILGKPFIPSTPPTGP